MIERKAIDRAAVSELVRYDERMSALVWNARSSGSPADLNFNKRWANKPVCVHLGDNGYMRLKLRGREYYAHRVIWCLTKTEALPDVIDHINQDKTDNRPSNLRAATFSLNGLNRSGGKGGIYYLKRDRPSRWRATLKHDGIFLLNREFPTEVEARAARAKAIADNGLGDWV